MSRCDPYDEYNPADDEPEGECPGSPNGRHHGYEDETVYGDKVWICEECGHVEGAALRRRGALR